MMDKYNKEYETIMEKYGLLRTVVRERFPSKLKLSENFIRAFREEFKNQTASTLTEDEDGNQISNPGRNKHTVLREFQKALKFLTKGV
jgi:hypothetical protein